MSSNRPRDATPGPERGMSDGKASQPAGPGARLSPVEGPIFVKMNNSCKKKMVHNLDDMFLEAVAKVGFDPERLRRE